MINKNSKISVPIQALSICISLFFLCNSPTLGIRFYLPIFVPALITGILYFMKKKIKLQFLHLVLFLFLLNIILHLNLSIGNTPDTTTSALAAQPLIFAFVFIFSSFSLNVIELKKVVNSFIWTGTGFSIYLFLFNFPMGAGHFSIKTFWGPYSYIDPNYLAAFMFVPAIISLKRALFTHQNLLNIILAAVNVLATVLTGSRAAFLAIGISLVLLMFTNWNIKTCLSIIFLLLVGYVISIITFDDSLFNRLFVNSYVDGSNMSRFFLWKQGIIYTLQNNPLTGTGLAPISLIIDNTSHNSFIAIFNYFGIIGFTFWSILMYKIFRALLNKDLYMFLSIYIGFIFVYSMIPGNISFGFWLIVLLLTMVIRFKQENPDVKIWQIL